MLRFAVRPQWLAWHLLLVVVLVSFTWLGRWQLGAYEDKAGGRAPGARPVVALDSLSRPGGRLTGDAAGRRVRVAGSYDLEHSMLVPGRVEPGGTQRGFLEVAFLRTGSGVLPVVRGWVPSAAVAAAKVPAEPVRVTGLLQRSETGPPPGDPAATDDGRLAYVATVTVLDATPYRAGELYDGYLALRSEQPSYGAPVPVEAQDLSSGGIGRWRNLAYALQWWLFAGAAVFFWWVVLRRAVLEHREPPPAPDGDPPSLVAPRRTT